MRTLAILLLLVLIAASCSSCSKKEGSAPEVTALDRTTHEPKFPIASGNHGTVDCNICHGAFDTFTEFSCTTSGCHEKAQVDPAHSGNPDYAYVDAKCLECHPKGEASFDHTRFPIGAGTTHPDKACSNCHKSPDRTKFECTACHEHDQPTMDGAHGTLAGYGWDSAKCYQCHPDGKIPPFDHTRFPIGAGARHADTCSNCHKTADRTKFDCTSCHEHDQPTMDGAHGTLAGYGWDSAKCYQCHPDGKIPPFDHTKFPIGTGAKHAETCSNCHKTADRTKFDCTSCHEHDQPTMDGAHGTLAGYGWDSAKCYQCHPDGQIPPFDHTWFPLGTGQTHTERTCSKCHPSVDRKQFSCTTSGCHDKAPTDTSHGSVAGYAYDSPQCLACHPDGRVTMVDHARYFPIASADKHANLSCGDCHTTPGNRKVTTCNVCHAHTSAAETPLHTGKVPDFSTDTVLCLRCHADAQVKRVATHLPFRIDATTKHFRTGCLQCHPKMRADKPYGADFSLAGLNCLTCHNKAQMDDTHQNFAGYSYQSQSCIKSGCHADGYKPEGL
ncbi:MAG: hypothetical protein QM765_09130 [Myxococcales bacterium]